MANYVKNQLSFDKATPKEKFDEVIDFITRKDEYGDLQFDFETLVPMPESLNIDASDETDQGYILARVMERIEDEYAEMAVTMILHESGFKSVFNEGFDQKTVAHRFRMLMKEIHAGVCYSQNAARAEAATFRLNRMFSRAKHAVPYGTSDTDDAVIVALWEDDKDPNWDKYNKNSLIKAIKKRGFNPYSITDLKLLVATDSDFRKIIELGKKALENYRLHGAKTWYDWSWKYWGTKWNAKECSIDRENYIIEFETAWTAPTMVLQALAKKFPDISFEHLYADDDHGGNSGMIKYYGKEPEHRFEIKTFELDSPEALNMYKFLWDCYEDWDEEDGEDVYEEEIEDPSSDDIE